MIPHLTERSDSGRGETYAKLGRHRVLLGIGDFSVSSDAKKSDSYPIEYAKYERCQGCSRLQCD